MSDTEMITCKAGGRCKWPRGPVQPAHRFTRATGGRWAHCVSCRAYAARKQAERRQRELALLPPPPPPPTASVTDIDPVYAAALRGWLLGLVIRREASPLTREFAESGPAGAGASFGGPEKRTCNNRYCANTHYTHYKLCPTCREKVRQNHKIRQERLLKRAAYGSEGK